jgi:hypothetical protein
METIKKLIREKQVDLEALKNLSVSYCKLLGVKPVCSVSYDIESDEIISEESNFINPEYYTCGYKQLERYLYNISKEIDTNPGFDFASAIKYINETWIDSYNQLIKDIENAIKYEKIRKIGKVERKRQIKGLTIAMSVFFIILVIVVIVIVSIILLNRSNYTIFESQYNSDFDRWMGGDKLFDPDWYRQHAWRMRHSP